MDALYQELSLENVFKPVNAQLLVLFLRPSLWLNSVTFWVNGYVVVLCLELWSAVTSVTKTVTMKKYNISYKKLTNLFALTYDTKHTLLLVQALHILLFEGQSKALFRKAIMKIGYQIQGAIHEQGASFFISINPVFIVMPSITKNRGSPFIRTDSSLLVCE